MLIGVESDKFILFRHVHAVGVFGLEVVVTAVQAVLEGVGHGHQFDGAGGAEGLAGGAAAASAAADEGYFQCVID